MSYRPSNAAIEKLTQRFLAGKLKAPKPDQVHPQSSINQQLRLFWRALSEASTDGDRLRLVRHTAETARVPGWEKYAGSRRVKHQRLRRCADGPCRICFAAAQVQHHIVMLKRGGNNSERNLLALCRDCHDKVHPWLDQRQDGLDADQRSHLREISTP